MPYTDQQEWDGRCNMCGAAADRDDRDGLTVWTCPNECKWSRNRIDSDR